MSINKAVKDFKTLIENAIVQGGTTAKNNLIRSSKPINLIHEAVKLNLIKNGVKPIFIRPLLNQSTGELPIYGFLKKKTQDITVIPNGIFPIPEKMVLNKIDKFGHAFTEKILSINVRSQLSSAAKNFDTLYERTFAESLNLHERCPNMILGEVYMIAVREYDISASDNNIVKFKPLDNNIKNHVEKYIQYFELLNNRASSVNDKHKYERVTLVLVDFSKPTPVVYNSDKDLISDGLLSTTSQASIQNLTFDTLVPNLLKHYQTRFGIPSFT